MRKASQKVVHLKYITDTLDGCEMFLCPECDAEFDIRPEFYPFRDGTTGGAILAGWYWRWCPVCGVRFDGVKYPIGVRSAHGTTWETLGFFARNPE